MKRSITFFGAFLVLCLMASTVMAGTTTVAGSGAAANYAIAHEALGQQRVITLTGVSTTATANNVAIGFTLGQNLTAGSLLNIQLDSALSFQAAPYYVCAANTGGSGATASPLTTDSVQIGLATPSSGATNTLFVLNSATSGAAVTTGNLLYVSTNTCGNTTSAANLIVAANATTGLKPITASITLAGVTVDPSVGANAVKVVNEFTPNLSANDLIKIDYLSTPYDGTHLEYDNTLGTNVIAISPNKLVVNRTTVDFFTYNTGAPNGSVTLAQVMTLQDSAAWQGVSKVYLVQTTNISGSNCLVGNVIANNTSPSGNITLTAAGNGAFNGTLAQNTTLCVQVTGSSALTSRTISGNYSFTATSGGIAPSGESGKTFQVWIPNGYQSFQPYMYVGSSDTDDVFVRLYNNYSREALVFVDVYPVDGSASQTLTLANIPANTAGTYWARNIGSAAGYSVGSSFAARFTVTAPLDKVNGVSFMKRTTGGEREMPLYKGVTPGQYLFE